MTIKFEEFDVTTLNFEKMQLSKNKSILLPKIEEIHDQPKIRLPEIELMHYGIPKISQYFNAPTNLG